MGEHPDSLAAHAANVNPISSGLPPPTGGPSANPTLSYPQNPSLINVPSVYYDSENLPPVVDDTNPTTENLPTEPSNPNPAHNSRKQARLDRAQRIAQETAQWVRTKFSLPPSEMVFASFSAALVRHILIQGRIHITSTSICFYAKIFGRITKESWPFSTMSRVKKRRGVSLVANALKIYFLDETIAPVVIASLNHRERAFNTIQDRLREMNPSAAESRHPEDDDYASNASVTSGHACSEDRSLEDDEYHTHPDNTNSILPDASVTALGEPTLPQQTSRSHQVSELSVESLRANGRPTTSKSRIRHVIKKSNESDSSDISSRRSSDIDRMGNNHVNSHLTNEVAGTSNVSETTLTWRSADDHVDKIAGNAYHKRTERARTVLNAPVKEVFSILFTGDWFHHYHEACNNKDVSFTDWQRDKDGYMSRTLSFRKPLGYKIGPKETRVKEIQKYSFTSEGGVVLELEGHNLDAPYGDYFTCESFIELSPVGDGSSTLLVMSIAVHFKKSTMLKGRIESGALAETETAYQKAVELARTIIHKRIQQRQQQSGNDGKSTSKNTGQVNIGSTGVARKEEIASQKSVAILNTTDVNQKTGNDTEEIVSSSVATTTTQAITNNPGIIKVEETSTTQWLRIAAIVALIFVCMLLVTVLIMLNRMRHEVSALELLISEHQNKSLAQCTQESCAAMTSSKTS